MREVAREERASGEGTEDAAGNRIVDDLGGRDQQGREVGGSQRDPAVAPGKRPRAPPGDLARRQQLVEHRGGVVADARGQDERLELARGQLRPGQLLDGSEEPIDTGVRLADALPAWQEVHECGRRHGLDLVAQGCDRAPTNLAQDIDVAPFRASMVGAESAGDDAAALHQSIQGAGRDRHTDAQGAGYVGRGEGSVRPRVARDEVAQGIGGDLQEGVGHASGQCSAEGVPQASGVLDAREMVATGNAHDDRTPLLED